MSSVVVHEMVIPLFGHVSDGIGRKRWYLLGAAVMAVFGFIYFALLDTGNPLLMFIVIVASLVPHDMMYGPQAALIAEAFTGRLRYSGASLGYQLAPVIAGGPAPLIAAAILAKTHSGAAIAVYVLICALVSLLSAAMLGDRTNQDISQEHHLEPARA